MASTWFFISAISGEMTIATPSISMRRQLITERLAAARRHQHERILPIQHIADHRLLIPFERRKAEILLQLVMQQGIDSNCFIVAVTDS